MIALWLAGKVFRRNIAKFAVRIAVSPVALQVLRSHTGLDAEVIGNGFWADDFTPGHPSTTRWRGGERPRVTFFGRVNEPRKGLSVFLDAIDQIRSQRAEIDFLVAGSGELPPRMPTGVSVELAKIDEASKARIFAQSDIFVAPHTGRESFGIVLVEAMAAGATVVASDLEAFCDVLDDGHGLVGATFPVGDSQGLAEAVIDRLDQPVDTARIMAQARQFDWSVIGPKIMCCYQRAVAVDDKEKLITL
jgi:phosphatidylinositol alpha-mannosyltransferase